MAPRGGIDATARWAAEAVGHSAEAGAGYAAALVGRPIGGAGEAELLGDVRGDLEAACGPTASVSPHVSKAVVSASDQLRTLPWSHEAARHRAMQAAPHPHGF